MPDGLFAYGLLGALAIALLIAAFTDLRRRQIDNWLTLTIAVTAPLFWWASGVSLWPDLGWQLLTAVICFVICAGLFAMGQMGGGDVKLLTALALWIQPLLFVRLIVLMALLGGLLTLVMGAIHLARKRQGQLRVPYGLAISAAGLWVIGSQYLPLFHNFTRGSGAG